MNYTQAQIPFTRIIGHKHFAYVQPDVMEQPHTVVSWEYPVDWTPGSEPYYPVDDDKNNELYQKYYELAQKEPNVIFGGRLGQYRYFDMDDTICEALKCVQSELLQY